MGRWFGVLLATALSLPDCAARTASPESPSVQTWERLCARLRPAPVSSRPVPPLDAARDVACQRSAYAATAAVVHIRTTVAGCARQPPAPPADGSPATRLVTNHPYASGGTGVIIDQAGIILTCAHVVHDAATIEVILPDGRCCTVASIAQDPQTDVALLRIRLDHLPALSPVRHTPSPGAAVVALGRPRVDDIAIRPGVVLSESTSLQEQLDPTGQCDYSDMLETSTALDPGFSGGPLLDANGRLVGLNVASAGASTGHPRGLALRFDDRLRAALDRLRDALLAPDDS